MTSNDSEYSLLDETRDNSIKGDDIEPDSFTFDDALDKIGVGWYQMLLLFICGGGWFLDGVQLGLVSLILDTLSAAFNLQSFERGFVGSSVFLGMMVGAAVGGLISDRFGRKIIFLWGSFFVSLCAITNAMAPDFYTFVVMRALVGLCLGSLVPTDQAVLMEFIPRKHRGTFMGLMNIFFSAGAIFVCLLAWATLENIEPSKAWRYFVGISGAPGVLVFLSRIMIPESPRFLMVNGQMDQAFRILKDVARYNRTFVPNGTLVNYNADPSGRKFSTIEQITKLFSPQLARTTILLIIIWFGLSYGNYGFGFLIPTEMLKKRSGDADSAINKYLNVYSKTLIVISVGVFGFVIVSLIMDKIGRRFLMCVSLLVGGVLVACLAISTNSIFVLVLSTIINLISTIPWAVIYTYTPEVYPTVIRATGVGLCSAFARLAGTVTPLIGTMMYDADRIYPFVSFGVVLVIAGFCAALLPIETLGRVLQDEVEKKDDEVIENPRQENVE